MSRIKFKIGISKSVLFNLPSKGKGDPNTFMGKVSINVPGLNCSNALSFDKVALISFCHDAELLYSSLKGKACISSKCKTFHLDVSGTAKGHIKIEVSMSHFQFSSPENNEWETKLCFYDYQESLAQLIECESAIKS